MNEHEGQKVWLWRDAQDGTVWLLGAKSSVIKKTLYAYAALHEDMVFDLFGKELVRELKELGTNDPICLELTVRMIDGKD